jgi:hypothetical protein
MAGKDHIYIMQSLDIPDAPRVKEIDSLIEGKGIFHYACVRAQQF